MPKRVMRLRKEDIIRALSEDDFSPYFKMADALRRKVVGDTIHLRAIIEFSNYCFRNCAYCGINCANNALKRYRMEPEEIISCGKNAYSAGYKTLVLQSGEDKRYTKEIIGQIVKELSDFGAIVTLSCGEREYEDYAYWKECGAQRYLLKHECANADLYAELHPGYTLAERVNCLKEIKKCGYETGSGFMIGLPGESAESIAENILLLDKLDCDMAGIGPFIPHPATPMKDCRPGSVEVTQKAVALTRILRPHMNLPATTALGVRDRDAYEQAFSRGANVLMKKVTPEKYRALYEIYPAEFKVRDIREEREELCGFIKDMGRIPE